MSKFVLFRAILFVAFLYAGEFAAFSQESNELKRRVVLNNNNALEKQLYYKSAIYEIQGNYDLKGKTVKIPEGCSIKFNGGFIKNGILEGTNTTIDAGDEQIFGTDLKLSGNWSRNTINVCWFGAKNDINYNSTEAFLAANRCAWQISPTKKEYEMYGETKTIKLYIPTGVYYVEGNKILGSIRKENDFKERNTNSLYEVDGDNSIIYWGVNHVEDVFFNFDYTLGHQSVRDLKIYVVNNTDKPFAGVVFKIGNDQPKNTTKGVNYSDAGMSLYSNVKITNSRRGKKGGVYKVFDVVGHGQCDQALVLRCTFEAFKYCYYSTNPESICWNFETCSFYTTYDEAKYFYFTLLSQYLMVNNSAFSYCDGQTLCEYDCTLKNGKLLGTDRDNIIFSKTRFEGYKKNGRDYFDIFKGNAGKLILEHCNFDASSSCQINHRFLLSDLGSLHIDNCAMAKALITIPKITQRSNGLGNQNSWAITASNLRCDELMIKGYDWDKNSIFDITNTFLSKNEDFRFADFKDFRGKSSNGYKLQSFYVIPCSGGGTVEYQERKFTHANKNGSLNQEIQLPPFCVVRKIEMYDKGEMSRDVDKIRIYVGGKNSGVFKDITLGTEGKAAGYIDLFEGSIVVFDEDIKKQKLYFTFITNEGKEVTGQGTLILSYTPLVNPYLYSLKNGTLYISGL